MEKKIWGITAIVLVIGLFGCAHSPTEKAAVGKSLTPLPTVVVATPAVKLEKDAKVTLIGTGFQPGQEIHILFKSDDGVLTDIGEALKPKPVPNKLGAWVTVWTCGAYLKNVKAGAYTFTVTTPDYDFLAHTPVAFYTEPKPEKKKEKK